LSSNKIVCAEAERIAPNAKRDSNCFFIVKEFVKTNIVFFFFVSKL
jgi:hypothetical protein